MSVDVSAEPADLEQGRARWRTAVAGVLAKSTRCGVDELGPEPEQMLETSTYEAVAIRALYTALDELPAKLRSVVVLKDVYGMSHEAIAEELGISVSAAKVRLHRARRKLRDVLYDEGAQADAV